MTVTRFPISFATGQVALGMRAAPGVDLPGALRAMGLTTGVPTITVVGPGSRPAQVARLGPFLAKVVVPVADAMAATVVDEGGARGLTGLLGDIRRRRKGSFPLVGVAAEDTAGADLDPEHTHFVLVPGGDGRAGARWVASVASALAGGNRSVAVVVAGGEPAWEAVGEHVRAGRAVLALSRSGGVAEQLGAAVAGRHADERATALAGSGQVGVVDPARGAAHAADVLRRALSRPHALGLAPSQDR